MRWSAERLIDGLGGAQDGRSNHGPERELKALDRAWLMKSFEVNAVGPLLMMAAFSPMLSTRGKRSHLMPTSQCC